MISKLLVLTNILMITIISFPAFSSLIGDTISGSIEYDNQTINLGSVEVGNQLIEFSNNDLVDGDGETWSLGISVDADSILFTFANADNMPVDLESFILTLSDLEWTEREGIITNLSISPGANPLGLTTSFVNSNGTSTITITHNQATAIPANDPAEIGTAVISIETEHQPRAIEPSTFWLFIIGLMVGTIRKN